MSWLSEVMGGSSYKNPSDSAMPYLNQIPGQAGGYFQPYISAGQRALPNLEGQFGLLTNNPGARLNDIGSAFQQSPGFQFALQQALQGAGHAAAAGGMAGSPQHEQEAMQLATNIGNQDYNNWLGNALGLYGMGLSGQQDIAHMGFQGSQSLSDLIAQTLAQQANLKYAGQQSKNNQQGRFLDFLGKGAGALAAFRNPPVPGA